MVKGQWVSIFSVCAVRVPLSYCYRPTLRGESDVWFRLATTKINNPRSANQDSSSFCGTAFEGLRGQRNQGVVFGQPIRKEYEMRNAKCEMRNARPPRGREKEGCWGSEYKRRTFLLEICVIDIVVFDSSHKLQFL
jgi:hypothetical protein